MNATPRPSRVLFAAAMIALGITGLVNGDFALVWQHVPAGVPMRTILARVCAVIELAFGVGLLWRPTLRVTGRVVFPYMVLWLVLLEVPNVVHSPLDAGSWGGVGEIGIITAGAWCLFAVGAGGIRGARWLLIIALPMIGVEVIADAIHGGSKIMPPWLQVLPHPAAWAILSGAGSIAACLGLLFGTWPRLAATLEAAMLGVIAIVYWGPYLHTGRTATTAFVISFLIAAGVWLVAESYRGVSWLATVRPVWEKDRVEAPAPEG